MVPRSLLCELPNERIPQQAGGYRRKTKTHREADGVQIHLRRSAFRSPDIGGDEKPDILLLNERKCVGFFDRLRLSQNHDLHIEVSLFDLYGREIADEDVSLFADGIDAVADAA